MNRCKYYIAMIIVILSVGLFAQSVEASKNTKSKNNYPDFVQELYSSYMKAVDKTGISLGIVTVTKSDDSIFYEFKLSKSNVMIHYYQGEFSSYSVQLSDKDDNKTLKKIISIAVAATENISVDDAQEIMQKLVNSFDGKSDSEAVKTEKYKYLLTEGSGLLETDALEIYPISANTEFDTSDYPEVNSQYMTAKMNKGEHGCFTGKVVKKVELSYANALEVTNEEGTFTIYYNPSQFAGDFEIGSKYKFYGDIAASNGYAGCLRIDYFEEVN